MKNMKRVLLISAIVLGTAFGAQAQRIKGSDTCLPMSQKLAEEYMKANRGASVTVTGGGSGVGITSLLEGTTDIAQLSRKIKFDERQKIQEQGKRATEVIVAYDALAVIVNPGNGVSQLTREQLEGIFTGEITNWQQVGGADMRIIPYSRETSSGTYEFFKENVMRNRNYVNGIMSMPATGAIIQSVGQTRGAIAYVGLGYLNNNSIKALRVSYDEGKTYVAPSVENAKNETYPIVRPLYYYYDSSTEQRARPFINYVLSPAGQQIIADIGFITVE